MASVRNLTQQQIDKIQIDEGLIYIDFGEAGERILGPTRGGGEFTVTNTVRDIEFDGRRGKTKGLQVIDDQAATLKVSTLCCTQDDLALGVPGAVVQVSGDSKVVTNPDANDVIPGTSYLKNAVMFAKLIDGTYKKITIYNPMHEGAFSFKAVQKSENEHALELVAHFNPLDVSEKLWEVEEVDALPVSGA